MSSKYSFYRYKKSDKVYWLDKYDTTGDFVFSFDKKKLYNLFRDYPEKLSPEEWLTFNEENEYWSDFFKFQNEKYEMDHREEIERIKAQRGG